MEERCRVLAAVADALFPPLKDQALLSLGAGDELTARLYEVSGGGSEEVLLKVGKCGAAGRGGPGSCEPLRAAARSVLQRIAAEAPAIA